MITIADVERWDWATDADREPGGALYEERMRYAANGLIPWELLTRTERSRCARYDFLAHNPWRTDDEDAEMQQLREELRTASMLPRWEPSEREP